MVRIIYLSLIYFEPVYLDRYLLISHFQPRPAQLHLLTGISTLYLPAMKFFLIYGIHNFTFKLNFRYEFVHRYSNTCYLPSMCLDCPRCREKIWLLLEQHSTFFHLTGILYFHHCLSLGFSLRRILHRILLLHLFLIPRVLIKM